MDAGAIQGLLEKLGCERIKVSGRGWVNATCPFATWKHSGGRDEHPSFGVQVASGGRSFYRCHGCQNSGGLIQMLWKLGEVSGKNFSDLAALVNKEDQSSLNEMKKRASQAAYEPQPIEVAGVTVSPDNAPRKHRDKLELVESPLLPEDHALRFRELDDESRDYLYKKRGFAQQTIELWELGWQPEARRIVVPIRDLKGRLVALSGRAIDENREPKWLHSTGFRRDFYLYGEHRITPGGTGYVVEGFFDVIGLWEKGYVGGAAIMGGHISKIQVLKLIQLFSRIVVVPDGDNPGYETARRVEQELRGRIPVRVADVPHGKDPDELTFEELAELVGPPDREVTRKEA